MRSVIIGLPDMGKVCSEKHMPAYLEKAAELRDAGVEKMVCVAIKEPEQVQAWAEKMGIADGKTVRPACSSFLDCLDKRNTAGRAAASQTICWGSPLGLQVQALADKKGSLARLLGVEKDGMTHRHDPAYVLS